MSLVKFHATVGVRSDGLRSVSDALEDSLAVVRQPRVRSSTETQSRRIRAACSVGLPAPVLIVHDFVVSDFFVSDFVVREGKGARTSTDAHGRILLR